MNRLAKEISEFTSFSSADVKGILEILRNLLMFHLEEGENVELEGIGTFSVSLQCPPYTTSQEVTPTEVHFHKVNFRCAKALRNSLLDIKLERALEKTRLDAKPEKIRRNNILTYLKDHQTISSSDCRYINRCSKYLAVKDVNALLDEGKIARIGSLHHARYVLAAG